MSKLNKSNAAACLAGGALLLFVHFSTRAQEAAEQTTPAQVNLAVQEVQKLCQGETAKGTVPGIAVAIVYKDHLLFAAGYGVRDVETKEQVNADTVFQLASLSKPIGSTVVAALIRGGKISWDSRISDLDPGFEMYDPWVTREITIRDFYSHRSGLPHHAGDLLEDLGFSREEILHRLRYQKPDSSFRSHYAYTNFGITEAGVAAAKAYGMNWEDASDQKLYQPLGMSSTSSRYTDFIARPNKALGHVQENGKWVQKFKRDPDTESPAGGVSSSVNDLAKWMRLQLANGQYDGEQLIDAKALSDTRSPEMLTGFSPLSGLPAFYGLGWNVNYDEQGRLRLGHSGAFALGAATTVLLVPSQQLGIVVLTNAYPIGVAEGVAFTFTDLALNGKATQDWLPLFKKLFSNPAAAGLDVGADYSRPPASPAPALANGAYVGSYLNNYFGEIQIIEANGGLAIVEGPQKLSFPLKHYDRDLFTYETIGENGTGATGVTFTIGADQKANTAVVESLNVRGEGVFKRIFP